MLATPKQAEGTVRSLKLGFRNHALAQLEIADSFGQGFAARRSRASRPTPTLPADTFVFTPPKGADIAEQ